ncbi:hypothetical protein BVH01_08765 [Pseudomonas sp. PA1(2017)]|nr:hypothetical protein BVH01_08765 [Pseudomonas sp. PA1(2017)]
MTYSDSLIEAMLRDFGANKGYRYRAINIYNLPFGFAYMTEANDLYGLKVDAAIAKSIEEQSIGFKVGYNRLVIRKKDVKGTRVRFYFNNHRIGGSNFAGDSIDLVIAEINNSSRDSNVLYTKRLEFDSAFFFNTYKRRERLKEFAIKYL